MKGRTLGRERTCVSLRNQWKIFVNRFASRFGTAKAEVWGRARAAQATRPTPSGRRPLVCEHSRGRGEPLSDSFKHCLAVFKR